VAVELGSYGAKVNRDKVNRDADLFGVIRSVSDTLERRSGSGFSISEILRTIAAAEKDPLHPLHAAVGSEADERLCHSQPRTYGYCRTSTLVQMESLEVQKQTIGSYCALYDIPPLHGMFVDQASASKFKFFARQAGGALALALRPGDHVVITKVDRGFRNLRDMLHVLDVWSARDISLHLLDCNLDTRSAIGRMVVSVLGAVAEWEANRLSERMQEIIAYRNEQLRPLFSCPPIGTVWDSDDYATRRIKLNPDERENMIAFCDWWEAGVGAKKIAEHCGKIGLEVPESGKHNEHNGKKYRYNRVRRLIQFERELRQIREDHFSGDPDSDESEMILIWIRDYYVTGRTMAIFRNTRRNYYSKIKRRW
jgi:DNA invertase Pin-like site-specific DNA recombinase